VHEAYLRLIGQNRVDWTCRAQVLALAARMMRRILVNHAKARNTDKRGNGCCIELDRDLESLAAVQIGIEPLDEVLNRLAALDQRQARIVEMRFFAGLSVEETAAALDISKATVKREWKSARLWLTRELERP
jgi:RNA polymerase sigma-70 factor (ECF subfamily)